MSGCVGELQTKASAEETANATLRRKLAEQVQRCRRLEEELQVLKEKSSELEVTTEKHLVLIICIIIDNKLIVVHLLCVVLLS